MLNRIFRHFSLLLFVVFFFTGASTVLAEYQGASFCNFTPDGSSKGNITISNSCVIYESVNGVAEGDLTLSPGAIVTLNHNLVFAPLRQINIGTDAKIFINTGSSISQGKMCIRKGATGYPIMTGGSTTDPTTGLPTTTSLKQLDMQPAIFSAPSTYTCPAIACTDQITTNCYDFRENYSSLAYVDMTGEGTEFGSSDSDLLALGFEINGVTSALAAAGDVVVALPRNLIVNGKIGIGITQPSVALDVAGAGTFTGTITAPTFSGALSGNATTATDLAANGANCADGSFPLGVTAGGAAETCTAVSTLAPTLTGTGASGTWGIAITGNAGTSTSFSTGRTNYKGVTDAAVAGQLMWKQYGNYHTIFDASNGTSPQGGVVDTTNSALAWVSSYPTLMGWNGSTTHGVRVDSARNADTTDGFSLNQNVTTAGTPTFSTLYTGNWFRSTGATGWYNGTYAAGVYSTAAGRVDLYPAGADLYVPGSIGIGTTAPTSSLDVYGGELRVRTATANSIVRLYDTTANASFQIAAGDIALFTSATERLRIDATTGNIGIGTATPTDRLQVYGGNLALSSGASRYIYIPGVSTGADVAGNHLVIRAGDAGCGVCSLGAVGGNLYLRPGANIGGATSEPYVNIADTYGNVGIGVAGVPSYRLIVKGENTLSTSWTISIRNSANTNNLSVRNDGYAYIKAASWAYNSDRRLKNNINYISGGLDKILNLKPAKFDYIDGLKKQIGFIAQDVQPIIPEAVSITDPETGMLGLQSDFIVPYLVKGIQEQQIQITDLIKQSSDMSLSSSTDLIIKETANSNFTVTNKKSNTLLAKIAGFAELIAGKLRVGLVEAQRIVVNGVDVMKKITELNNKIDSQQKQIDSLIREIESLKK